jgi:uncharacterized protein YndB with AHSA1/START domain
VAEKNDPMTGELTLTRVFNAPRTLVFDAWTDAKHMAQWWGPHHFTNPVCEIEARAGGRINIHMRGTDGTTHVTQGQFVEFVRPEKLVFINNARDLNGTLLLEGMTTVLFADEGGKTRLTLHTRVKGHVPMAPMMLKGMEMGWSQSLERLAAVAAALQTAR